MFRSLFADLSHHDPDVRAGARRRRNLLFAVVGLTLVTPAAIGLRKWRYERNMDRFLRETHTYLREGEVSEANSSALDAFGRDPNDPRSLRAMGYFASYVGAEEAKLFWDMLESGHGGCTVEDYMVRIFCAEKRGELELAAGLAGDALERYPADGELLIEASRLLGSNEIGDWKTAVQWAERAAEHLPSGDLRPRLRRAVAVLRGRLGGPGELNSSVMELARLGRRGDELALEAIGQLIELSRGGGAELIDPRGLLQLVQEHSQASFAMKLQVFDIMIVAAPQDGPVVMRQAIADWQALDGADLLALCSWLNDHRAYRRTLEIVSDEKMRVAPELVGPRAEALLNLGRFKKLEEVLSIPRLALPEAHRHYILANATAVAGWPVGGRDLEDHLQAAETACKNAARPDVAMAVGRLAMESGYLSLARRAFTYAKGYPSTGVDAERGLLELADETLNPLEAAERARRIARLLPESVDARAESLERRLESGGELELVLAEVEELAARHPNRGDVARVLARARRMHGMFVEEPELADKQPENEVTASAASTPVTGGENPEGDHRPVAAGNKAEASAGVADSPPVLVPALPAGRLPGMAPGMIPGTGTMSGSVFGKWPATPVNVSGNGS